MMDFSSLANYREAWHAALSWCFGGLPGSTWVWERFRDRQVRRPGPAHLGRGAGFEVALNMQIVTGDGPIGESDAAQ